jgi:uncharacterized protein with NRDE domain
MCLVAIALDQDRRFPLVVAVNRDEYFERPTARLAWWSPAPGAPEILGGRDLKEGGTWLGITAAGRLALVTNIRRPGSFDPEAPSRGTIVPLWLRGQHTAERFWVQVALSGYNPFNVIAADFRRGECFWASSDVASPRRLDRGLYGLSNAGLDTPWPKVTALKASVREALVCADSAHALSTCLFAALADRTPVDDAALPDTGVPLDWERQLSPAFIRTPDQRYGTRSSTVVVAERAHKRIVTHVYERTYPPAAGLALLRHSQLRDWPPKYSDEEPVAAVVSAVADLAEGEVPKRTRVRTLLKPDRRRPA